MYAGNPVLDPVHMTFCPDEIEIQETHPKHRKLDSQTALPHRARGRVSDGLRPKAWPLWASRRDQDPCRLSTVCEPRRCYPKDAYVFVSERGGLSTASSSASARLPRCPFRSTHTCCAMPVGSSSPTMATTRGRCSTTSGTRISSTRSDTRNGARPVQGLLERLTLGLGHLGAAASGRRQARDDFRFRLNHHGIRAGFPRRQNLLDDLDSPLDLLVGHCFDAAGVLDLHLPRQAHRFSYKPQAVGYAPFQLRPPRAF